MNRFHMQSVFLPSFLKAWHVTIAFVALAFFGFKDVQAANLWQNAAGAEASKDGIVPSVAVTETANGNQIATYTFPKARYSVDDSGIADVVVPGVGNFGTAGAPSLPVMAARLAVPQDRTVKSVSIEVGTAEKVGIGLVVRHVQTSVVPGARVVSTPRDEAIYSSATPYPARPYSEWRLARKNGIAFCEVLLSPVVYIPSSGEVRSYSEITVTVELEPVAASPRASARSQATAKTVTFSSYIAESVPADILALIDNPGVANRYKAASRSASGFRMQATASLLPCSSAMSYRHVVITTSALRSAFAELVKYRNDGGMSSVLVTLDEIDANYQGAEPKYRIREFIRDAYLNWGTEYVVLGGDVDSIPTHFISAEMAVTPNQKENVLIPTDLYFQCLDGDDDIYAEVKIGRIPSHSAAEVANWLAKVKRYDRDCVAGKDYTRGALFAAELLNGEITEEGMLAPAELVDCYGKKLVEQIRIGREFPGTSEGVDTYGFMDAPEFFDQDKMVVLYDKDRDPRYVHGASGAAWTTSDLVTLINSKRVSIINHVGHSAPTENMRLSVSDAESLQNDGAPFFVYSQGCQAGDFTTDSIAESFINSANGAFAGVWNSFNGFYDFAQSGVDNTGASQRFMRRFWDAVFADGFHDIGSANMLSHERNASYLLVRNPKPEMVIAYHETNLFGDPAQKIGGPDTFVEFDREAYKSTATAKISYYVNADEEPYVDAVFTAADSKGTAYELAPREYQKTIRLYPETISAARNTYTNSVILSDYSFEHGATINIALATASMVNDSAFIDDVAPVISGIKLLNPTESSLTANWETDEPATAVVTVSKTLPFGTDAVSVSIDEFLSEFTAEIEDLDTGLYYCRIVVEDKAGNITSVPTENAAPADYPRIVVSPRETRAEFDMESNTSTWSLAPVNSAAYTNCWQLGVPTYGPLNASRCWGTVINGRYPDAVNDALVSPSVTLRSNPSLIFRQWYDIEETPEGASDLSIADCGIIEISATSPDGSCIEGTLIDGTWHNVSEFNNGGKAFYVRGKSAGWENVRIDLPAEYSNMSVRIRFRFVSDSFKMEQGNPAGWYIDGVQFLDVPADGVALSVAEIDDTVGDQAAVGYGDGCLQPGETVRIKLSSFNCTLSPIALDSNFGTVAISAGGYTTSDVSIAGASSATVTYPVLQPGISSEANDYIEVRISENVAFGTPVTLTQTLRDQNGKEYVSSVILRVESTCVIKGTVTQPGGNPVIGAVVMVNASDRDYTYTTGADGTYVLRGLPADRFAEVSVSYGFAADSEIVKTPADDDVDFVLPLAEIGVEKTVFEEQGYTDVGPVYDSIVITNFFTLAAADGNIGPSADLEYTVWYDTKDGTCPDWFELDGSETGSIAPNGTGEIGFTLYPDRVDSTKEHVLDLKIYSNAWNEEVVTVQIRFSVEAVLYLQSDDTETDDLIEDAPVDIEGGECYPDAANDFDGYLEEGEIGRVLISLLNPDDFETITRFEGHVAVESGDAEIISDTNPDHPATNYPAGDTVVWRNIRPGKSAVADNPLYIKWGSGDTVVLVITGDAYFRDGFLSSPQEIYVVLTSSPRNSVTGVFTKRYNPNEQMDISFPVEGARVFAEDADGNVLESTLTDEDGNYSLNGLVPGKEYWISYETAAGDYDSVPPAAFLLTDIQNCDPPANVTGDEIALPIEGFTYSNAVAHLTLDSVSVADADGDGHIEIGENLVLDIALRNNRAFTPEGGLSAIISTPDFECGNGFMELVGSTDLVEGPDYHFTNVLVHVSENAVNGDYQRFALEVHDGSTYDRVWYFDFKLAIESYSMVFGSVTNTVPDGVVAGTRIVIESNDGSFRKTYTLRDKYASGDFSFGPFDPTEPPTDFTVTLAKVPAGYSCADTVRNVTIGAGDSVLAPFKLLPYGIVVQDGLDENGEIAITVNEGESASVTVALENKGGVATDAQLDIVYNRKASEVIPADKLDPVSAVITVAKAKSLALGTDWTKLDPKVYTTGEIEVLFAEGTPIEARDEYLQRHGFVASYHFKTIPASIAVPGRSASALALAAEAIANAATLTADDDDLVVAVQPSVICYSTKTMPSDELVDEQWALRNVRQNGGTLGVDIGAEEAWDFTGSHGSSDIIVAVTDTGTDVSHPDLIKNLWSGKGWNFADNNSDVSDHVGHGTHVAGIIGAVGNNGIGVCGVNWKTSIMTCRIVYDSGMFTTSARIAQAFEYAYMNGAKVNNNSWGGPEYSSLLDAAIAKGEEYDMLFVCAAGNEALDLDVTVTYPAAFAATHDNMIIVGAADSDGNIAEFSNYSPKLVHIAAPGVDILSTYYTDRTGSTYESLDGTSMASPYVSGAAAFLWSIAPNASYKVIKDAILNGVRKDEGLAEFVRTSGHLDLAKSVKLLGRQWLRFGGYGDEVVLSKPVSIPAGGTAEIDLLANDEPALSAGEYSAVLRVSDDAGFTEIPVKLTVQPAPIAEIKSVTITDASFDQDVWIDDMPAGDVTPVTTDDDNPASHAARYWVDKAYPGESAKLSIILANSGSLELEDVTATLTGPGIDVAIEKEFGYISEHDFSDPQTFDVVFPTGTDMVEYTLDIYAEENLVKTETFQINLFTGTLMAVKVTDNDNPVPNAVVEVYGAEAASGITDAEGFAYLAVPDSAASVTADVVPNYTLRVLSDGAMTYIDEDFDLASYVEVQLEHSSVEVTPDNILDITISEGSAIQTNLYLSASTGVTGTLCLAPTAKIAVIDDGDDSAFLVDMLRDTGFDVDYYKENYQVIKVLNPINMAAQIQHTVRYSWDDATIFGYDAVIAVLTGANGKGRVLVDSEIKAYRDYIDRGGKVIFAGNTALARPDNVELAEIIGFDDDACNEVLIENEYARTDIDIDCEPFISLWAGDAFPACAGLYDDACDLMQISGDRIAVSDINTGVAKLYESETSSLGGKTLFWNGLYSDWQHRGVALDLLRGYLFNEFADGQSVDWLTISRSFVTLDPETDTEVALSVNQNRSLASGEYSATLLLVADVDGTEVTPITVKLTVEPPSLRAHNLTGNVKDFGDRNLRGDGGRESCMIQLVYAGADGVPNAPAPDGSATGDDVILCASGTGLPYSFIGAGAEVLADTGRFDVEFNLGYLPELNNENGVFVYVRAWDGPTASSSVAYGDSKLVEVTYTDSIPDAIDFGSWIVNNSADSARDSNGDSIPDAWILRYRPDLDPRDPVAALDGSVEMDPVGYIETAHAPTSYDGAGNPARVFVTDKFVFVLEQFQHRVAVYDRESPYALVSYYGATNKNGVAQNYTAQTSVADIHYSNKDGGFNMPFGMAFDTFNPNQNRFAVADTQNGRVQLFTFDPDNGQITFVDSYGESTDFNLSGTDADTATLLEPRALAFTKSGDLIVADTGNHRILRMKTTNNKLAYKTKYAFDNTSEIVGLCYDRDSSEGFWIADNGKTKLRIAYYRTAQFSPAEPVVTYTFKSDPKYSNDNFSDVQIWTVNGRKRICVADYSGSRVQILDAQPASSYESVNLVADFGCYSDDSLQDYEKLYQPNGVFPIDGTNVIYVADYGHNMIKWFNVNLDSDGDGMDDIWEDLHGLDSTVNDALDDADGDGLLNIGEFRAGTDPQNKDTDGDGVGDLTEMVDLRDPLTPDNDPDDPWTPVIVENIATFDVEMVPQERFLVGENVNIVATFTDEKLPAANGSVVLFNAQGSAVGNGTMFVTGNSMKFQWTATEEAVGMVSAKFTFPECDEVITNLTDLFEVYVQSPAPVEEEEVPWYITSIVVDNSAVPSVVLTWDMPDDIPAEGCIFRVEYRTSLTSGDWISFPTEVSDVLDSDDCRISIPLPQLEYPSECFFRLFWKNKELQTQTF